MNDAHQARQPSRTGWRRLRSLAAVDVSPLREAGQFRLLISSRTVTMLGTQAAAVALLVQVQRMTGSTLLTGLLGAVEIIPMVIFGLAGGVLADRLDRRLLALRAEAGLGLVAVLLAVNALLPHPALWPVYACAAAEMTLAALQRPSLEAAVPQLLSRGQLPAAAALMSIGANIAAIAGPALGGLLATGPGPAAVYLTDAASYLLSLLLLFALRPLPRQQPGQDAGQAPEGEEPRAESGLRDVLDGLKYARSRPDLLGSYLVDLTAMLLAYPESLFPFLAVRLHAAWSVGLMFSASAAGALIASATSGWLARVRHHGRAIAAAAAAYGLCLAGLGLAPGVPIALGCLLLAGSADEISAMFRDTFWNQTIPGRLRGRLAGVEMLSYSLGPSAGQVRAGLVARLAGTRFALWSGGLLCVLGVGLTCMALPALLAYDAGADAPAEDAVTAGET
jgi:MFS family permease